ncbi:hypothetical protein [Hypericibacter adhaerens]|uniref:hypothetical protein n=1 Tax=Hypericibacter adhaerens TaxID=2602016 RepID=UPI0012449416
MAGEDLNRWMVRQGQTLAYRHFTETYVSAEDEARKAGAGYGRRSSLTPGIGGSNISPRHIPQLGWAQPVSCGAGPLSRAACAAPKTCFSDSESC